MKLYTHIEGVNTNVPDTKLWIKAVHKAFKIEGYTDQPLKKEADGLFIVRTTTSGQKLVDTFIRYRKPVYEIILNGDGTGTYRHHRPVTN